MEPLAVDLALLRALETPELRLVPGRALMARVVARDPAGRGTLSIAGLPINARLPEHLRAGDHVRLTVREVTAERVVLAMSEPPAVAVNPPGMVPLPGGGQLRVQEQYGPARRAGDALHALALRYEAPALGAIDLRFELDDGRLRLAVALAPGAALERATAAADELRQALAEATHRTTTVTVSPRRDPLDLYA